MDKCEHVWVPQISGDITATEGCEKCLAIRPAQHQTANTGRVIKFRAWSEKDKRWCGAFSIHKSGLFSELINAAIRMPQLQAIADAHWQDLSMENPDGIVVMQFTGLRDKNGTEIFDGDLVKVDPNNPRQVVYEAGAFYTKCLHDFDTDHLIAYYAPSEIEVVGNIYEHPHLLTV